MNRVRLFAVSKDNLLAILMGKIVLSFDQLPMDAKVINVNFDWPTQSMQFLVESEIYDEVIPGHCPPYESGIRLFVKSKEPAE